MLAKHFLSGADRLAYNLSIIEDQGTKPFLQRHEIAMDRVFAQRLAVPGLDRSVLAPWLNKIKPYMSSADRPTPKTPVANGGALSPRGRFGYNLSMVTAAPGLSFIKKHELALDFALAETLAVPGLDFEVFKNPAYLSLSYREPALKFFDAKVLRQISGDHQLALSLAVPHLDRVLLGR